jgi:ribosomal protein S27AE
MQRKFENMPQKSCPRCGAAPLKTWEELNGEQKFLVERLALSGDFTLAERKKHRFCAKCFYEEIQSDQENV